MGTLWEGFEINVLVHMKQSSNIKALFKEIHFVDSYELNWLTK